MWDIGNTTRFRSCFDHGLGERGSVAQGKDDVSEDRSFGRESMFPRSHHIDGTWSMPSLANCIVNAKAMENSWSFRLPGPMPEKGLLVIIST